MSSEKGHPVNGKMLKVGELARRCGVSVRALHHYEAVGVLEPARRTRAGHRLYAAAELKRLQQIVSLRQLGFSLAQIRACFQRQPDFSLRQVIQMHLQRLDEQITYRRRLRDRLRRIAHALQSGREPSIEQLLRTIEVTTMTQKYFSETQRKQLQERARLLGEDRIREAEAQWKRLLERFEAEMKAGTDPADERAQVLAREAAALVGEFTGGDEGIARSVGRMYAQEGPSAIMARHGWTIDQSVFDYMWRAMAASS